MPRDPSADPSLLEIKMILIIHFMRLSHRRKAPPNAATHSPLQEFFMHTFPQQDGRFDLSRIDLRRLTPGQWIGLKAQIICRARSDRNTAIGMAIGGALGWIWRAFRSPL